MCRMPACLPRRILQPHTRLDQLHLRTGRLSGCRTTWGQCWDGKVMVCFTDEARRAEVRWWSASEEGKSGQLSNAPMSRQSPLCDDKA
jgi:hypothetical protein